MDASPSFTSDYFETLNIMRTALLKRFPGISLETSGGGNGLMGLSITLSLLHFS